MLVPPVSSVSHMTAMRLRRGLGEFAIEGIETTIPLFQQLLSEPDIIDGHYDIHWLEHYLARNV